MGLSKKLIAAGALLFAIGLGVGHLAIPPRVQKARVFEMDGHPKVMRLYREKARDGVMYEKSEGVFRPWKEYAATLKDKADSDVAYGQMRKTVHWYDDDYTLPEVKIRSRSDAGTDAN